MLLFFFQTKHVSGVRQQLALLGHVRDAQARDDAVSGGRGGVCGLRQTGNRAATCRRSSGENSDPQRRKYDRPEHLHRGWAHRIRQVSGRLR